MREVEKRLQRLEAVFGHRGCVCVGQPPLIVVDERGKTENEIDAEIARQVAQCPVHGPTPELVVTLRSFAGQVSV